MRRVSRAADDGYANDLVPGVRATADAEHLADELAFAAARLAALGSSPPGLYAEAAGADREEGLWLAFQIAYLGPLEGPDPWAGIEAARTTWVSGELPRADEVPLGPRTAHDAARGPATLAAYRAWATRAGSQADGLAGEPGWSAQRRFDRAYERLALPGFGRTARYEFLTLAGALGLADLEPTSLQLSDASAPITVAAKRVFGIGDLLLIARRAGELAGVAGLPLGTFDLGLQNWSRPTDARVRAGVAVGDDVVSAHRGPITAALGL